MYIIIAFNTETHRAHEFSAIYYFFSFASFFSAGTAKKFAFIYGYKRYT